MTRPLRSALALLAACLLVASAGVAYAAPGSATPQPVEDRESFTVETGAIRLDSDGLICAEKQSADVNKVTITHARLEDVTIHLTEGGVRQRIEMDSARVEESLVMYTNGENAQVNLLATLDACIPLDQANTVVEAYYITSSSLDSEGMAFVTETDATGEVPEPGGLDLGALAANNSTGPSGPTDVTGTVNETIDVVENTTETVEGTVGGTTDTVNETVEAPTETVENTTDLVGGTTDNATDTVNETVENTTDAVDDATGGATDDTTDTVDETVDDTTDTVTNTTDSTEEVVDGTTDTVDGTTNETADTVDGTLTNTTDTLTGATNTSDDEETTDTDDGSLLGLAAWSGGW
jgi:hypothetical protein